MRHAPSRTELWTRVAISVVGLLLLTAALMAHGIANAPALVEVVAVAGVFFGISLVRALRALWRARR